MNRKYLIQFETIVMLLFSLLIMVACSSSIDPSAETHRFSQDSVLVSPSEFTPTIAVVSKSSSTQGDLTPVSSTISSLIPRTPSPETTPKILTQSPSLPATITLPSPTNTTLAIIDSTGYMALPSNDTLWNPEFPNLIRLPDASIRFSSMPWSPDGKYLAISFSDRDGLGILELETGSKNYIDNIPFDASSPHWSPDGRYLLFEPVHQKFAEESSTHVYDIIEQKVVAETMPRILVSLVGWSSDSSAIAYLAWSDNPLHEGSLPLLVVYDLTTGEEEQFRNPIHNYWFKASWSPIDRQLLMYGSDPSLGIPERGMTQYNYTSIDLLNVDSGKVERLLPSTQAIHDQSSSLDDKRESYFINAFPWLPDGESFIYSDETMICLFDLELRLRECPAILNDTIKSIDSATGRYPAWSPSGDRIGFILSFPAAYGGPVAVIQSDGSDLHYTDRESGGATLLGPVWSPKQ